MCHSFLATNWRCVPPGSGRKDVTAHGMKAAGASGLCQCPVLSSPPGVMQAGLSVCCTGRGFMLILRTSELRKPSFFVMSCKWTYSTFVLERCSFFKLLLAHSCFTMFCWVLLYKKVNQLYIYPLLSRFSPHLGHHRALGRVLCAMKQVLTVYFIYKSVYMLVPVSQFIPPPLHSLIYTFVLYVCDSISVFQINSSVTFF